METPRQKTTREMVKTIIERESLNKTNAYKFIMNLKSKFGNPINWTFKKELKEQINKYFEYDIRDVQEIDLKGVK